MLRTRSMQLTVLHSLRLPLSSAATASAYADYKSQDCCAVAEGFTGDWTEHSACLLSARFQLQNGMTLTTIVAYAPTNSSSDVDKEQFALLLASVLSALPKRDLIVVLGDFNVQIGSDSASFSDIRGPHSVQPDTANSNGTRLLDMASSYQLVIANTLFPHIRIHQYTQEMTYRGFDRGSSDHYLLVMSLKLRLSSNRQQQQPASAMAAVCYATDRLQQAQVAQQYNISLANRFSQLPTTPSDVETEWTAMRSATQDTAQSIIGRQLHQMQHKPGLTEGTLSVINRKQQAFKAWELLKHKQQHIQQQEAAAQQAGSSQQ
ncbi:hypothetical protein R1flu_003476 [Riccia fluitans]|uniref:Endonuclease/exonuclease/phosphatase domain-containing protein n=1 Tax=Riccia fluitans TaxID=41844 RepID=A0ABD1Y944_9MARC